MDQLNALIEGTLYSFILVFIRAGTAIMLIPGPGDSFVPTRVRLLFALALAVVMTPAVADSLPPQPAAVLQFATLIIMEFIIGLLIGTVARILMAALNVAGMVISLHSGLGNAQIFNPGSAGQGSIYGAALSMMGVTFLFVTNMHHLILMAIYKSYIQFPAGTLPITGDMAHLIARLINTSFTAGVQMAGPFMIVGILIYMGIGVLARLMPQIQLFFMTLSVQILMGFVTLSIVLSAIMLFWVSMFEDHFIGFLQVAGS